MARGERVFRPRATVIVCLAIGSAFIAGAAFLLITLRSSPSQSGFERFSIVLIAAIAVVVTFLLGRVRAVARDDVLDVRNPVRRHRVEWTAIVAVRLGRHDSWAQLDLDDGTTLALMAVQAADGPRARRDLAWLRERVASSEGEEPDGGS